MKADRRKKPSGRKWRDVKIKEMQAQTPSEMFGAAWSFPAPIPFPEPQDFFG